MKLTLLFIPFFYLLSFQQACNNDEGQASENTSTPVVNETPVDEPAAKNDSIISVQEIESIQVFILESHPVQVKLTLAGNYNNGCTTFHSFRTNREANTVSLTAYSVQPKDAICTEALVPFTKSINLPLDGLEPGPVTVKSGSASATFQLPE